MYKRDGPVHDADVSASHPSSIKQYTLLHKNITIIFKALHNIPLSTSTSASHTNHLHHPTNI